MTSKLIYDSSTNADLFYATKFFVPDPVIFVEKNGKKYLFLSDLELSRGKKEAEVHFVKPLKPFLDQVAKKNKHSNAASVVAMVVKSLGIRRLQVPHSTSFSLVDGLRKNGIQVEPGTAPFYEERTFKTPQEKKYIETAQKNVFASIGWAETILKQSKIRGNSLVWRGKILTSEILRYEISRFLLERGYMAQDTIVAGGTQSVDPHGVGSGPLKPHQAIIVDVFPRCTKNGFHGDATRTFCKGRAPDVLKKQFFAVQQAQEMGLSEIRAGKNGKVIHGNIVRFFETTGFPVQVKNGNKEGFIHGTGHGIGLEIHEEPVRITNRDFILKAGHVVTVEPGLYYQPLGGVRLEDIVFVTKNGCEVLARYPKKLEIS